jgi:hypothetical protein
MARCLDNKGSIVPDLKKTGTESNGMGHRVVLHRENSQHKCFWQLNSAHSDWFKCFPRHKACLAKKNIKCNTLHYFRRLPRYSLLTKYIKSIMAHILHTPSLAHFKLPAIDNEPMVRVLFFKRVTLLPCLVSHTMARSEILCCWLWGKTQAWEGCCWHACCWSCWNSCCYQRWKGTFSCLLIR